jgi:hypothetical protein
LPTSGNEEVTELESLVEGNSGTYSVTDLADSHDHLLKYGLDLHRSCVNKSSLLKLRLALEQDGQPFPRDFKTLLNGLIDKDKSVCIQVLLGPLLQ